MFKIKNKFIIFILFLLLSIVLTLIITTFLSIKSNTYSYVVLIKGKAILNNGLLEIDNKEKLNIGDTVRTFGKNALAVLEWGDGSVTRIGGDSSVKIEDLYISEDTGTINIGFELLNGKSWSNVVSFLGEDSYFKEYFKDSEAAARGTVFSLDLNNNYLQVIDHKVTVNTLEKSITVGENKPFNINTFNFISLEEFIKGIKDSAWQNMNSKIDKEYILGLKTKLNEDIEKLSNFKDVNLENVLKNVVEKEKLYKKLLSDYQKLNFVKSDDKELFKTKLELKNTLIKLADNKNKAMLIENTLYDFKDSILKKEYANISIITTILSENKDLLPNIDFQVYFPTKIIPEKLKEIFNRDFNKLKIIFGNTFSLGIDFNDIINKGDSIIKGTLDKGEEKLNNLLNN